MIMTMAVGNKLIQPLIHERQGDNESDDSDDENSSLLPLAPFPRLVFDRDTGHMVPSSPPYAPPVTTNTNMSKLCMETIHEDNMLESEPCEREEDRNPYGSSGTTNPETKKKCCPCVVM